MSMQPFTIGVDWLEIACLKEVFADTAFLFGMADVTLMNYMYELQQGTSHFENILIE